MGFEPTPVFTDQNAQHFAKLLFQTWVWRLRPLGHTDLHFTVCCMDGTLYRIDSKIKESFVNQYYKGFKEKLEDS